VSRSEAQLSQLEATHRVYDLYIWLAWRVEEAFPDRLLVEEWRADCSELIRQGLEFMSRRRGNATRYDSPPLLGQVLGAGVEGRLL